MNLSPEFLQLNVGFIIHQTVGYARDFPFEAPLVHLPPDLEVRDLAGAVRVTRTAQGLLLQARLQAYATVECVRCLGEFPQVLEVEFTELYAFSHASVTESELILPENGKIDLAPILRDEMLVAMPIKPLCQPGCLGLCPICGENRNLVHCQHAEPPAEP